MKQSKPMWIAALAAIALLLLLSPASARAQSCALCYTQAASSGQRMIQALKSGILVLVVPPTLGSIGLVFVVYRKRNQTRGESEFPREEDDRADSNQDW
jgi:hypothetical protein